MKEDYYRKKYDYGQRKDELEDRVKSMERDEIRLSERISDIIRSRGNDLRSVIGSLETARRQVKEDAMGTFGIIWVPLKTFSIIYNLITLVLCHFRPCLVNK